MEEKGLSPGMLLHQSWKIFKQHWFFLLFVAIVGYLIMLIPTILQVIINKPSAFSQGIFAILHILFTLFITIGWIKISLKLVKGEKASFFDLFKGFPQILNLLVTDLLVLLAVIAAPLVVFLVVGMPAIIIGSNVSGEYGQYFGQHPWLGLTALISLFLGILFAIIAFFYVMLKYMLVSYFVVDCYEGPVEAMKMSSRASKGVKWDLLSLFILSAIIVFLSILFFVVGIFVAFPVIYLAYASAYRELVETTRWQGIAN